MSNRLTQIATRTGDNGTTGLGDNTRVSKDSLRVHAMGDVDELNSHIGLLLCEDMPGGVRELLVQVQHQLFNLGGELSIPGFELLKDEAVAALDGALEQYNSSCRPARGPPRWPMSAGPSPVVLSVPWCPSGRLKPCARPRGSTSIGSVICFLCWPACSTA
ncbi:MAG: hypothetical protein RLZZ153_1816 [Pseudomonadota bacterium]|jgi:hypothetical protein